jgi:Holliday junction resolvase
MGSKSKNKGKGWERDVANFLSTLYNESFIRTPSSGAYIGGKNSVRKDFLHEGQIRSMKGDITPPSNWKHFNVECKNYAAFPFHQLFSNTKILLLEEWIKQLLEAADTGDFNFIIMKFDRKGKYILFPHNHTANIQVSRHITYFSETNNNWTFTGFDEFWQNNKDIVQALSINGTF